MSKIVIDASVCGAWVLARGPDEGASDTLPLLRGSQGIVPDIWRYEVSNLLLVSVRQDALSRSEMYQRWLVLVRLRLVTVHMDVGPGLVDFARQHGLSLYDAAYLQLARQERAPLATLDKRLASAAIDAGIDVLA